MWIPGSLRIRLVLAATFMYPWVVLAGGEGAPPPTRNVFHPVPTKDPVRGLLDRTQAPPGLRIDNILDVVGHKVLLKLYDDEGFPDGILYLVDHKADTVHRLHPGYRVHSAVLCPDGSAVAAVTSSPDPLRLVLFPVGEGEVIRLEDRLVRMYSLRWLNDRVLSYALETMDEAPPLMVYDLDLMRSASMVGYPSAEDAAHVDVVRSLHDRLADRHAAALAAGEESQTEMEGAGPEPDDRTMGVPQTWNAYRDELEYDNEEDRKVAAQLYGPILITNAMPALKLPYPCNESWQVTCGYGCGYHTGNAAYALDFAQSGCNSWRKPILAAAGGTASTIDSGGSGYGKHVLIDHGGGWYSAYAHLDSFSVGNGASVNQGTEIGRCGNTGNVSGTACPEHPGTHLHFHLRENSTARKPEPMSGYTNFTQGSWYTSDNCGGGGGNPCAGTDNAQYDNWESWPYDNDVVNPGQTFTKQWRMKNTGSSTWRKSCNHKFAFDGGERFNAVEYTELGDNEAIAPGQTKVWSVAMTAPTTPGIYTGYWKTDRYGTGRFGDRVWVKVQVASPATQITSHPGNQYPCPGANATFSVSATGQNLSYRWQFNNNDIYDGGRYAGTGTPTLTVSNCDSSVVGSYRCVVTGSGGTATSNSASLTLLASTQVTGHPSSAARCPGESVTFTASGTGHDLSYRWQKNGSDLSDGGGYSGTGSGTLTVGGIHSGHAGQYRCRISGTCGTQFTAEATLTVRQPTTVTQHPQGGRLCPGANASFSVAGTGEGGISGYQWYRNGAPLSNGGRISGATGPTLTISNLLPDDAGNYTCTLSAGCGTATSSPAALEIATPTAVITPPQDQVVCQGQSLVFTVSAQGDGTVSYQWMRNGSDLADGGGISGSQTPTLQIAGATAAHAGQYACRVAAGCGTVVSAVATLTVQTPIQILQQPVAQNGCVGGTVMLSVEVAGESPTFQWYRDDLALTDGGNILGAAGPTLQISPAGPADTGSYHCVVGSGCGSLASAGVPVAVYPPVQILVQPRNVEVYAGRPARMSVVAEGTFTTYQWYHNGMAMTDDGHVVGTQGPLLTFLACGPEDVGNYQCVVGNPCGSVASQAVTLSLGPGWQGSDGPLYRLMPADINGGGGYASGGIYGLWYSMAQNGGVGDTVSASYAFRDGFWPMVFAGVPLFFVPPDFDRDGDVDAADLQHMLACFTGEQLGPPAAGCENADLDGDDDVDQSDFAIFQRCLSGPGVNPETSCAS